MGKKQHDKHDADVPVESVVSTLHESHEAEQDRAAATAVSADKDMSTELATVADKQEEPAERGIEPPEGADPDKAAETDAAHEAAEAASGSGREGSAGCAQGTDRPFSFVEPDSNVAAAAAAAAIAYGGGVAFNGLFAGNLTPGVAEAAAAFLRKWPDAKPDAIAIHLRRAGFADVPDPKRRELAAWKVFATTLSELDRSDLDARNEREAEQLLMNIATALWPGDLSYQPQAGGFDPSGFSPER